MFLYSAALVAVVAAILAVTAVSLKPFQTRSEQIEQKQMVLRAMGIEASTSEAETLYAEHIEESATADSLPLYKYHTETADGIILPMRGTGLWGPIWCYVAFDPQWTIVGAVFDHKGETPGLGGEIATPKFAERFVGKKVVGENGTMVPIKLKKNADRQSAFEVDAISGGTMTSNGVTNMFATNLEKYKRLIEGGVDE